MQKYLADCGLGSRRACERFITEGAVTIDGVVVTTLETRIDPDEQRVGFRGRIVTPKAKRVHVVLNKPKRVYTAGRFNSEGLLLVTNDGALAYRLTHPRYHVVKTYEVWINTRLSERRMRNPSERGCRSGELLRVKEVPFLNSDRIGFRYLVKLIEGKSVKVRKKEPVDGSLGPVIIKRGVMRPELVLRPPGHPIRQRSCCSSLISMGAEG